MATAVGLPRAVVLDLDGTLADTAPDIAAALNHALAAEGLRPFSLDGVKSMVGGGTRKLVERALAATLGSAEPAHIDRTLAVFSDAYVAAPCRDTVLFPGAHAVIEELRGHGVRIGVCTNKPERMTAAVLDGLAIAPLIDRVVAGSDRLALKPAPDMLWAVLAALDAPKEHAVMVGDSGADVGCAKAAGVRSIVLGHGYTTTPAGDLGADLVIDGFPDLVAALRALA